MELLMEHLGQGLALILMLSLPVVLTAAAVGLVVGILQAVTQVQEQTISAAPKILAVFLLIILGGGMMMNLLTGYLRESVVIAFQEIPQSENFVLPPRDKSADKARLHKFFKAKAATKGGIDALGATAGIGGVLEEAKTPPNVGVSVNKPGSPLRITEQMTLHKQGR